MSENQTLLVVDDERDIVEAYQSFLAPKDLGEAKKSSRGGGGAAVAAPAGGKISYTILTAYSGEEALALFESEFKAGRRIAGGFFDVKLGGPLDGLSLLQKIWAIDPDVNATVVTAYHDRNVDDIDQMFGEKFKDQWDYLNKPFTRAEIIQKARQMTASWNRKQSLQAAQAQLIHSERMVAIGQVSRGIGHEFGNILQAIVGKADLALLDTDMLKIQDKLKMILLASDRASLIIRNLQFFSKTSAHKVKTSVAQMFASTLSLIEHDLKKNTITIVPKHADDAQVVANAPEIEQVIMNLVINAMHAMPKGGQIEVGSEVKGDKVVFWVKDTGSGIPEEVLPRIFDFAFTTKGEKGSGLGLSISKGIIENHGGQIEVQTQAGKGTLFRMILPKAP